MKNEQSNNPYWYLFEDTGNVEAYLAYRLYQDKLNKEYGEDKQVDIYGGESNRDSNP